MKRILQGMLTLGCILIAGFPVAISAANNADQAGGNAVEQSSPITIFIMFDGFRTDYLDRGVTPTLSGLAVSGVRGKLTPAFPSVSLPNHFSQITGLYPDEHGIVGNVFEDSLMPTTFNPFKDRESIKNPRWWAGGQPLWATAEEQGLKATLTYWSASGYDRDGKSGKNVVPMEFSSSPEQIADRLLGWFDGAPDDAPSISFALFHHADTAGHKYGPDAPETNAAIAQLDAAVGKIVDGLKRRGLWERVNMVFAADHGMSKYVPGQTIFLDKLANPKNFRLVGDGPYAEVVPDNGVTVDQLARELVGHHGPMTCWRKEDLPARFRFGKNARVAPIFCLADPGWIIVKSENFDPDYWAGAGHGYDPETSGMGALFLAHGPAFCSGVKSTQRIDAVDIYPLLANIAGIKPHQNSGNISRFDVFLRQKKQCRV